MAVIVTGGGARIKLPGAAAPWYNGPMTRDEFEDRMRTLVRRRPFRQFTIVLLTGERIEVDVPEAVAWGGGAAGYLSARGEPTLFDCSQVQEIVDPMPEPAS